MEFIFPPKSTLKSPDAQRSFFLRRSANFPAKDSRFLHSTKLTFSCMAAANPVLIGALVLRINGGQRIDYQTSTAQLRGTGHLNKIIMSIDLEIKTKAFARTHR